jgi:hypothetical protein
MDRMQKWFVCDDGLTEGFPTADEARAHANARLTEYNATGDMRSDWLYWGKVSQDAVKQDDGTYKLKDVR